MYATALTLTVLQSIAGGCPFNVDSVLISSSRISFHNIVQCNTLWNQILYECFLLVSTVVSIFVRIRLRISRVRIFHLVLNGFYVSLLIQMYS